MKTHPLERNELKQLLTIIAQNVKVDNGNYTGNLSISKLSEFLLNTYALPLGSQSTDANEISRHILQYMCFMWESLDTERLVLKERKLHFSIIQTIFNSSTLYYAAKGDKELANLLKTSGLSIIGHGFSKRGFLPLLSSQLCQFMKRYGAMLDSEDANYDWLILILFKCFTQPQMNTNIFNMKPVIAHLYDKKLSIYYGEKHCLYKSVYGISEISNKIFTINALLLTTDIFKRQFISEVVEETNLLVSKKRIDGPEEMERLALWELLIMCRHAMKSINLPSSITNAILHNIEIDEGSPLVRIYKEWFIAYELAENYNESTSTPNEDYVFNLLIDHSKPVLVVSAEKICFLILKALKLKGKQDTTRLLDRFICELVPNATSNKPLVRHFSNSLILSFWPVFKDMVLNPTLKSILGNLFENSQRTQIHGQYRSGDANIWNLYDDLTLTNIFGGVIRKITDHEAPYLSEETFNTYLLDKNLFEIGKDEPLLWLRKRSGLEVVSQKTASPINAGSQLQTKSGAWETVFDIDNKKSHQIVKRSDLIVVSSLVDKPPNLGGICRLCDVLGVGLLTVQDLRVKNHPQFKNVAVTADRWQPMVEVPVDEITKFMKSKKQEGYTLIGLEQTDKSVQLDNNYKFPRKSLILLGTEAHGIPGPLLNELDLCLEIKQHGVIRSMNIQTATAVIVHSYTVQHL